MTIHIRDSRRSALEEEVARLSAQRTRIAKRLIELRRALRRRPKRVTPEERFWGYVRRNPEPGCWLWSGPVRGHRGRYLTWEGRQRSARWVAWLLTNGEALADGTLFQANCLDSECIAPRHMTPVRRRIARV